MKEVLSYKVIIKQFSVEYIKKLEAKLEDYQNL